MSIQKANEISNERIKESEYRHEYKEPKVVKTFDFSKEMNKNELSQKVRIKN